MTRRIAALAVLAAVALAVAVKDPLASPSPGQSDGPQAAEYERGVRAEPPELAPQPRARSAVRRVDPTRCADAIALPAGLERVSLARWSPDSRTLAVTRVVTTPARNVMGFEEDPELLLLDTRTWRLSSLGIGSAPRWSSSGTFLAFWHEGKLAIVAGGAVTAELEPTMPEIGWDGDTLLYWVGNEVRGWREWTASTVASFPFTPRYPLDDIYLSADGARFTLTRYYRDRSEPERYLGFTREGRFEPLHAVGARLLDWAPSGHTLLLRFPDRLELRDEDGNTRSASLAQTRGPLHLWTPDAKRLLLGNGSITPEGTVALDEFSVWDGNAAAETKHLPNLFWSRSFSPDGTLFSGVRRGGGTATALAIYRCS